MPIVPMNKSGLLTTRSIVEIGGQIVSDVTNSSNFAVSWVNDSSFERNSRWKAQVRNHESATVGYAAVKQRVEVTNGRCHIVSNDNLGRRDTWIQNGWMIQFIDPPLSGVSGDVADTVYLNFIRKAQRELRSINGLQTLGELAELVHQVRHPLEALRRGFSSYLEAVPKRAKKAVRFSLPRDIDSDLTQRGVLLPRSGRPRRARKLPTRRQAIADAISGTYLEYANGWRPAIADIESASKALAEHFNPSGVGYRKVNASAKGTPDVTVSPEEAHTSGGPFSWYQFCVKRVEPSARMTGEVVVSSTGSVEDLRRNAGFTLAGFVPTMWELLPLSYVADYFSNMGDVLEAIAFNTATVAWWSRTVRVKSSNTYSGQIRPPLPGITFERYDGDPGKVVWSQTSVNRDNPLGWRPSLVFTLPGSHLLSKLANVSSLLAQANNSSRQLNRLLNG